MAEHGLSKYENRFRQVINSNLQNYFVIARRNTACFNFEWIAFVEINFHGITLNQFFMTKYWFSAKSAILIPMKVLSNFMVHPYVLTNSKVTNYRCQNLCKTLKKPSSKIESVKEQTRFLGFPNLKYLLDLRSWFV